MLVTVSTLPNMAGTGVFTFIASSFGRSSEINAASDNRPNIQMVPILKAAINPDPNPSKGGGDITVVGGTALLPEAGPSGTLADVEEPHPSSQISLYVVREGDTLSSIAKMFKVSVNTIRWSNDLKGTTLAPSQTLIILPISGIQHIVKKGDTVESIAKKYKADAHEIVSFNNIEDGTLTLGETILVPDGEIDMPLIVPGKPSPKGNPVHDAGGPNYDSYYGRPLQGGVLTQGLHGYNGVDLANSIGTPIYAAAPGEVIISRNYGWNGGYGKYIVIQHPNGTQTLYGHLSENVVFAGAHVERGQIIGALGNTGKSTGPHLHFEVRGAHNPFAN